MKTNSFDIDGVLTIGIFPGPNDIIITGRSFEESSETLEMLKNKGIVNDVYYNPLLYDEKTRVSSGKHKATTLNRLKDQGLEIGNHFEDDEIQKEIIERECPWINVIHVVHNLTNKENCRHFNE